MKTHIGDKLFEDIPRRVAKFRENRSRDVETPVDEKKYKLECWKLTCQFPTWQSPVWSSSRRHKWLITNQPLHESLVSLSSVRVHLQLTQSQSWLPWQGKGETRLLFRTTLSPALTQSHSVSLSLTQSHSVSHSLTQSHSVSLRVTQSHWVSLNLTQSHSVSVSRRLYLGNGARYEVIYY